MAKAALLASAPALASPDQRIRMPRSRRRKRGHSPDPVGACLRCNRRPLNGFHLKSSCARTRRPVQAHSAALGYRAYLPGRSRQSAVAQAQSPLLERPWLHCFVSLARQQIIRALPLRSLPSTTIGDALMSASSSIMLCCNCLSCRANLPRNHQRRRTAFLRDQTPRLCRGARGCTVHEHL